MTLYYARLIVVRSLVIVANLMLRTSVRLLPELAEPLVDEEPPLLLTASAALAEGGAPYYRPTRFDVACAQFATEYGVHLYAASGNATVIAAGARQC